MKVRNQASLYLYRTLQTRKICCTEKMRVAGDNSADSHNILIILTLEKKNAQ